jgi:uncharacterized protein YjcR
VVTGEIISAPDVPYLTMADIAAVYRISPRTARRWASHDRWRRTSGKPRRYHGGDVQASYDRHHGGRVARHLVNRYSNVTDEA